MDVDRITLAVENMPGMVAFFNGVFDAGLEPVDEAEPNGFHRGAFLGTDLMLCPNEIAGVDARQGRHQFRLSAGAADELGRAITDHGGSISSDTAIDRPDGGTRRLIAASDPDGNSYEFISQ